MYTPLLALLNYQTKSPKTPVVPKTFESTLPCVCWHLKLRNSAAPGCMKTTKWPHFSQLFRNFLSRPSDSGGAVTLKWTPNPDEAGTIQRPPDVTVTKDVTMELRPGTPADKKNAQHQ
jgi:hypothetical protein